ncbi:MBL fold metallo-hydrolase [Variovorax ginsengisoli]|uniref:Glyoxylase-like metal-dependent hydrolase (Beta-lactamase superfamily II) n=1 Tax=Variovorax ginsengisoli TaxID=363844 RepID=A0ABT9S1G7_9BURK|nr:MBL fold metallo-hydrolase [Variovorax ginsengisoli]MDP9898200.1 glyoxylase-like metal-dependent hydrolase (beta-lactamase superfamily II) [Variovorax ginsengisoli]
MFERGWLSANGVLFKGSEHCVLVDTGYVSHASQTIALVTQALEGRPLDRVVNTHLHSDHCGGNAALQRHYPALQTYIPAGEADHVAQWDEDRLSFRVTGQQCPRFRFDHVLQPGSDQWLGDRAWQVHGAPGHDPHSIILFEPASGTLISADALWENGFGVVFPELVGEPSFDDVAATLDVIESLAPRTVIPGHGRIFSDVANALATARRRLNGLASQPHKHAWHALKVLMKFKLLEVQALSAENWQQWCRDTPYFGMIQSRFFGDRGLSALLEEVLADLVASGAARRDHDGRVSNL